MNRSISNDKTLFVNHQINPTEGIEESKIEYQTDDPVLGLTYLTHRLIRVSETDYACEVNVVFDDESTGRTQIVLLYMNNQLISADYYQWQGDAETGEFVSIDEPIANFALTITDNPEVSTLNIVNATTSLPIINTEIDKHLDPNFIENVTRANENIWDLSKSVKPVSMAFFNRG